MNAHLPRGLAISAHSIHVLCVCAGRGGGHPQTVCLSVPEYVQPSKMGPVLIKPSLVSRLQPVLGVHSALQPEGEDIWTADSGPKAD